MLDSFVTNISNPHNVALGPGNEQVTVWGEADSTHIAIFHSRFGVVRGYVGVECGYALACVRVKDLSRSLRTGGKILSIPTVANAANDRIMHEVF